MSISGATRARRFGNGRRARWRRRIGSSRPGAIEHTSRPDFRRASAKPQKRIAMKFRPLHDRVIVERIEETEERVGGIIIPDSAREKPQQGKIIGAGNGRIEKEGG